MGKIQPVLRPPLAIPGTREQPVDEPFVSVGPRVGQKRGDFFGSGGQAGQVIGHAADQGDPISLRRVGKLGAFQLGQDEPVDRVLDPVATSRTEGGSDLSRG